GRAAGVPYVAARGSAPYASPDTARTRNIVAVRMHGRQRGAPDGRTSSVQTFMAAARQPSVLNLRSLHVSEAPDGRRRNRADGPAVIVGHVHLEVSRRG